MNLREMFPSTTERAKTVANTAILTSCRPDWMLFLGTYVVVLKALLSSTHANMWHTVRKTGCLKP